MSAILNSFKVKPFDIEPIFAAWPDAPRFTGNPKKDPPVQLWLDNLKQGCVQRKVPEEVWHKVAQHYMGDVATARFAVIKQVLCEVNGGKYRWTWKKFCSAMSGIPWDIDSRETVPMKVSKRSSGSWWVVGKTVEEPQEMAVEQQKPKSRKNSDASPPPPPAKDATAASSTRKTPVRTKTEMVEASLPRKTPIRTMSDSFMAVVKSTPSGVPIPPPMPKRAVTEPIQTVIANAPAWLVNTVNALDYLASEHPKAMTTISAVLITAGSIPAMPAIAGGAGGVILASHAVQAIGAVAVGLGTWLKTAQDAHQQLQAAMQ